MKAGRSSCDEKQWTRFSEQEAAHVKPVVRAKPFIKWAGGKGRLVAQLDALLPDGFSGIEDLTYAEPFVGGGAMLFHMLQTYGNIRHVIINDINPDLTTCYTIVRDRPEELIRSLRAIQEEYYLMQGQDAKREYYLRVRERFNAKVADPVENTALLLFLNRTCFNGLYRVNKSGGFNVPFGRYERPVICDENVIRADSVLLKKVTIMTGDFEQTLGQVRGRAFFYFDPPYRPLSSTSSFRDYAKEAFDDAEQIRLKQFCDRLHEAGILFMLSNADCLGNTGKDRFLDDLYAQYTISRVNAVRSVNADASGRGKITELLVRNYIEHRVGHRARTTS